MNKAKTEKFQIDEEHPYSQINVTIQIRVLHGEITRSRFTANIYPDPALARIAKQELHEEEYGHTESGDFCVNFCPAWLDLNHGYPALSLDTGNEFSAESVKEMNDALKKSVDWILGLHRKAMHSSSPR